MYLKTYHPKGPSIRVNKNRTGIKILNDQNEFMQQFVVRLQDISYIYKEHIEGLLLHNTFTKILIFNDMYLDF
ncbi:hypothetical protein RhiirC2_455201 [Rhizophagus irregularis]|uniref:Uncharacterized protein n=1 Tax=Rhizophagus irregularis TaxID=588596 RepID=A0A2N1N9V6_9GLOM|nr:hypothetical protein RhiirC2_455201 [Rhizophagus irregularis]